MVRKILWVITGSLVLAAFVFAPVVGVAASSTKKGPQYGGDLRVATSNIPGSFDPHTSRSGFDQVFLTTMFDSLIYLDSKGNFIPKWSLAESWEFPDSKTLVINLKKGVKFHDGTDFNAEALKYAIERVLDPATGSGAKGPISTIEKVEVVDQHKVILHLAQGWGSWMFALSSGAGSPVSPTAVGKLGKEHNFKPVGTGPFRFSKWVSGSYLKVVKNTGYWTTDDDGNKMPYLDSVTISIIPDEAVMSAAIKTGEVDVAKIAIKDVEKLDSMSGISVVALKGTGTMPHIFINASKPPMDNVHLRRALAYALDPGFINKAIFAGRYQVGRGGYQPPGHWAYYEKHDPYNDPERAKKELKLGGRPNGFDMDIVISSDTSVVQSAEIAQQQWAEVGIKVRLQTFDISTAAAKFFKNQEVPLFFGSSGGSVDPLNRYELFFKSSAYYRTGNAWVPSKGIDKLIAKMSSTADRDAQLKILREIEEITQGDVWMIPVLYRNLYMAHSDKVKGWGDRTFSSRFYLQVNPLWIEK